MCPQVSHSFFMRASWASCWDSGGYVQKENVVIGLRPGDNRHMATLKEKTARLKAANENVQDFVNKGGDLQSPEAVPLGMELVLAANEVGKDLGYNILVPINKAPKV
jgi:hypothetical protein